MLTRFCPCGGRSAAGGTTPAESVAGDRAFRKHSQWIAVLKWLSPAVFLLMPGLSAACAAESGAAELQKCKICHALEANGGNRVGPDLHGIIGRKAGTAANFAYSEAMRNSGTVWDDESLAKFLRDPKGALPGNRMSFPGITDETALNDLLQELRRATQ